MTRGGGRLGGGGGRGVLDSRLRGNDVDRGGNDVDRGGNDVDRGGNGVGGSGDDGTASAEMTRGGCGRLGGDVVPLMVLPSGWVWPLG